MDLVLEAHDLHHPIYLHRIYDEQKEYSPMKVIPFKKERIPKFFNFFERALKSNGAGEGKYLFGEEPSYVDLALFQVINGLQFSFPALLKQIEEQKTYPRIFNVANRIAERENIKSYLSSSRRLPRVPGTGIFRYYEEWQNL